MSAIQHGGRLDAAIAQYGGAREDWLDLSTGINPHAYPFGAPSHEAWARLPQEQEQQKLLETARQYYNIDAGSDLAMANGTQAIIQALSHVFETNEVAILAPTYGEYAQVFEQAYALYEHLARNHILVRVFDNLPDKLRFGLCESDEDLKRLKSVLNAFSDE